MMRVSRYWLVVLIRREYGLKVTRRVVMTLKRARACGMRKGLGW